MPTFFDIIPDDIHDIIAHFLFSSIRYPADHSCEVCSVQAIADDNLLDTLLEYAKNSPAQCQAVVRALSNRLYITNNWRSERSVEWITVSASHLKELYISGAPELSFPENPPWLPNLERAVIKIRADQMSLIHGTPQLRDLTVFAVAIDDWDRFVSTVSSLRLDVLDMRFAEANALERLSRVQLMGLRAACPYVQALNFVTRGDLTPDAWDMIEQMSSLKELGVNTHIPDEHVLFVQTLQELTLLGMVDIEEVTRFGPVVTNLEFHQAEDEQILQIQLLSNLRTLNISIQQEHESALVGMIMNVEELKLSWNHQGCNHKFERKKGAMNGWHPVYYEPDLDVLEEILRSPKHLKSLQIKQAVVSSDAIIKLLKIIGEKLETLEICHDWQKEPVPDRMECILKGVAKYSKSLKTLSFLETPYVGIEPYMPIFATKEQTKRCFRALEEVTKAVPGFSSYRHVRSMILYRFTQEQPELLTWHDMLQRPCV